MAPSLDEVLAKWDDRDIIKHQAPRGSNPSGSYYSDSQQPEGLLESGRRFFAHLTDPEAQALHRDGIDAVVSDLKNKSALPVKGVIVEGDFKLRKMVGLPMAVGALKQSIAQVIPRAATPAVPPRAATSAVPPQASTPATSCPSSPFSLVGKTRNRESALQIIARDLKKTFSFSGKSGYQPIPEDQDGKKLALRPFTKQRSSSTPYQATLLEEERTPLKAEDFPPADDSVTLKRIQAQQKKPSSSTPSLGKSGQGPDKNITFNV